MNDYPWLLSAVLGGVLIGAAAGALALLDGRIAGISGIVGGLMRPLRGERAWRWAFVAGLLLAPVVHVLVAPVPTAHLSRSLPLLLVAGLLVGFGTRLGSGCTSGHGICGLARLSRRSLAATLVFMGTAMVTVFVARHVLAG
jgi:uncharacterized membrane protein YedE/YeeE